MGLLLLWALCTLATSYCSAVPSQQSAKLLSRGCNDSDVLSFAGLALEDINKDRKDGYILSLNRVSDAREQRQCPQDEELDDEPERSLFYLTLDVLETACHVLSRKSWRDCEKTDLFNSVYGQCKALFFVNRPRRIFYTVAYNCTLRPVFPKSLVSLCPECPRPSSINDSDPMVLETVTESLANYNNESTSKQYSLVEVTKASIQCLWFADLSYCVEYLIKESLSPCTKSQNSSCALQSPHSLAVGLCKGFLMKAERDKMEKYVTVKCDFFKSQDAEPRDGDVVQLLPANLPMVQEVQQENAGPAEAQKETKGTVQILYDVDNEKTEQSQEQNPEEAFPVLLDLTTDPEGQSVNLGPLEEKLLFLPFPSKEQRSAECPGPAQNEDLLVFP